MESLDPRLLDYYQRELAYLRHAGGDSPTATQGGAPPATERRRMPGPASGAAAGRLRLAVRAAATPAGRRLPELTDALLEQLYPHALRDALLRHRPLRAGPGQGQAGRQLPHRARHPAVRGHHRRRQPAFPHQRRRHPVAAAARRRQPADRGRSPGRQRPGPGTRRPGAAAGKAGAGAAGRAAAEQPAHPLGRLAAQRRRALRPAVRPQPANQLPAALERPGRLHPPRRAAARLRLRRRRSAAAGRGRRASGARAAGGILRLPGKVRLLRPAAQPAAPSERQLEIVIAFERARPAAWASSTATSRWAARR